MKQIILLFLGVIIFITAVGIFSKDLAKKTKSTIATSKKEIVVGDSKILVEVADREDKRKKGLGGRESLGENEGMLFVFPESTSGVVFWMKDMKFAIDIIWIAGDKIIKIDKNVQPEPGVADEKLKLYNPETDIDYVLEVNAGFSDKNKIKVGDTALLAP